MSDDLKFNPVDPASPMTVSRYMDDMADAVVYAYQIAPKRVSIDLPKKFYPKRRLSRRRKKALLRGSAMIRDLRVRKTLTRRRKQKSEKGPGLSKSKWLFLWRVTHTAEDPLALRIRHDFEAEVDRAVLFPRYMSMGILHHPITTVTFE